MGNFWRSSLCKQVFVVGSRRVQRLHFHGAPRVSCVRLRSRVYSKATQKQVLFHKEFHLGWVLLLLPHLTVGGTQLPAAQLYVLFSSSFFLRCSSFKSVKSYLSKHNMQQQRYIFDPFLTYFNTLGMIMALPWPHAQTSSASFSPAWPNIVSTLFNIHQQKDEYRKIHAWTMLKIDKDC